jgi:hypothetical protein
MSTILGWFSGANWEAILGVAAAFILFFDRLAKITPSETDNKIVAFLQKVFSVLGAKVPDVK